MGSTVRSITVGLKWTGYPVCIDARNLVDARRRCAGISVVCVVRFIQTIVCPSLGKFCYERFEPAWIPG